MVITFSYCYNKISYIARAFCYSGCGTGRYLGISDKALVIGAERSKRFAEIARDRKLEVVVCDNIALPYRANCLDGIISVGVIHHFASVKRRLTALREMARVLLPGGRMLVCVWAVEQSERKVRKIVF